MRKYNSHLEDVWGIYTELQNSLSEQYAPEELMESANRLIEIAKENSQTENKGATCK